MIETSSIRGQMEVVGSDGRPVGKVDKVQGQDIKLTRMGAGPHHLLPLSFVKSVDEKVRLSITEDEAKIRWREIN